MTARPLLVIFTKAPYLGQAKSRLAAGIGKVHANRLYRAMIRRVLRSVSDPRWDVLLYVTPDRDGARSFNGVWPARLPRRVQGQGSLSPRLTKAMDAKRPIAVIGTDCPQIAARDVAAAFKALRGHDAVFGPADDGGFWLMAMDGPVPARAFDNVAWSTDTALSDVARNLGGAGRVKAAYLRTLVDVDDVEALRAVRAHRRN